MIQLNADERVLGYLGRALSLELSAVQLYSTQAVLASTWGLADVAEKFHAESREEMGHAERIISRMLALGGCTERITIASGRSRADITRAIAARPGFRERADQSL